MYNVQKILNERGYDLLKKRMWRDGHMFGGEHNQYVRSRDVKSVPSMYVYHANAALEVAAESFNTLGRVRLDVAYGVGREDDPDFEKTCREWVRQKESTFPCYQVSCVAEATIDGHTSARRLYRGFRDTGSATAFLGSDPGESCRLIDRHTGERSSVHRYV